MNITEIIEFFDKWQTLMGSFLGGVFALSVAFIVGHAVRRREEVSAGMILIGDLENFIVSFEILSDLAEKQNIPQEDFPYWFSEKLSYSFPQLSTLFQSSMTRMLPINVYLAAHLTLFYKIYSEAEITIKRLTEDIKTLHKQGKSDRPNGHLKADARIATRHFTYAAQHAKCAKPLIKSLVLSKTPAINKLRHFLRPKSDEKECIELLTKGSS